MPTIEASKKDLLNLIGKKLEDIRLEKTISYAKSEISGDEEVKIEIADVNRPDLLSIEGIARQCKLALGLISGLQEYKVKKTNYKIKANSKTRPLIVAAVVKNIKFNDQAIRQIIQLQEKLCEIFGRKRKEAALGIYDFDKIKWPVSYSDYEPQKIKFIPLEMKREMTGIEILKEHPTGQAYKHLLENESKFPLLIDSANQVLSMPPIINSNYSGKITQETKNVFIEVTGYNYRFLLPILNTVVTALADRGGKIETIKINNITTPDLSHSKYEIDVDEVNSVLGLNLDYKKIISLLKKAGYNASGSKKIKIDIPAYRQDILDSRDIIEDIAIAYGYNNIPFAKLQLASEGSESDLALLSKKIAELLVGLQFQEIATFTLSNHETLYKKMNKKPEKTIEVDNPLSELYCVMRQELLSSALNFLSKNKSATFPQKIFEIGNIIDDEGKDIPKLSIVSCHEKVNFTEIKQILEYLATMLSLDYSLETENKEEFIEGRCAKIISNGKIIGYFGEISPKILDNWNLEFPVSALEMNIENLVK